jgi:replicative DNA helicase
VSYGVEADFFHYDIPRFTWEAMVKVAARGQEITTATVFEELPKNQDIEPRVVELMSESLTTIGFDTNLELLREKHRYRQLLSAAGQIANEAYKAEGSFDVAAASAQALIRELTDYSKLGILTLSEVDIPNQEGPEWGVPVLDNYTFGVIPGELTILAGSTGDGKSMVAGQIARNLALAKHKVCIFSLEMAPAEWKRRNNHALARVRMVTDRFTEPLDEREEADLWLADATASELPISIVSKPGLRLEELLATAEVVINRDAPVLIVVDYLQLISTAGLEGNEAEKLGVVTSSLKRLAMDHQLHVLLVSQFNRSLFRDAMDSSSGVGRITCLYGGVDADGRERTFTVPSVAHLKGSSSIEQDADRIILLANHRYDDSDARQYPAACKHHIELFVAKQRNGLSGEHSTLIKDYWCGSIRRFSREELAVAHGSNIIPTEWLRDQGYHREQRRLDGTDPSSTTEVGTEQQGTGEEGGASSS